MCCNLGLRLLVKHGSTKYNQRFEIQILNKVAGFGVRIALRASGIGTGNVLQHPKLGSLHDPMPTLGTLF